MTLIFSADDIQQLAKRLMKGNLLGYFLLACTVINTYLIIYILKLTKKDINRDE